MPEPILEKGKIPSQKPEQSEKTPAKQPPVENPLADLHKQVGNRAVQRLIQRQAGGESQIDEETASRIDSNRGGGQALNPDVQESMGAAMGADFSDVRVHTSSESDELNTDLGAKAFTTGNDVFFSDGEYSPDTSEGQQLLAHELTHVVQQGSGETGSGGPMTVNEPGDAHEQEADSVAESVARQPVQKQDEEEIPAEAGLDERDLDLQMQADEEEEIQMQGDEEEEIQLQELEPEDEEEELQLQPSEEEEEELQP